MFQDYISLAAIDPDLPYSFTPPADKILFRYEPEGAGISFSYGVTDFPMTAAGLSNVPRHSLLVLNASLTVPALSTATAVFYGAGDIVLLRAPFSSNGLGCFQGAAPIPEDAVYASIQVLGATSGQIQGQVRVVNREVIPYQPLKG